LPFFVLKVTRGNKPILSNDNLPNPHLAPEQIFFLLGRYVSQKLDAPA